MKLNAKASLSITVSSTDETPFYQQIAQCIRERILNERLLAHSLLPSSRELSIQMGVSRSTVVQAYDLLVSEGWLVSQPKRGFFVAERLPELMSSMLTQRRETQSRANLQRLTVEENLQRIHFDSGADVRLFPNNAWSKALRQSALYPDLNVLKGHYASGLPALKVAIAEYIKDLRGLVCTPEQIIITSGNRDALSIISHSFFSIKTEYKKIPSPLGVKSFGQVWLENPTYVPMAAFFQWLGLAIKPIQIDEEGAVLPTLSQEHTLKRNVDNALIVLTPNRQYPLGHSMSSMRRQNWLSVLETVSKERTWLIEDDYDSEFLYQGRNHAPLMQLDQNDQVFYLGSFSKVMFRGLRMGYIIAPLTHAKKLQESQRQLGNTAALMAQPALSAFINSGDFSTHLRRMRRQYLERRNTLNSLLINYLSQWFEWQLPSGGMHQLILFQPQWIQKNKVTIKKIQSGGLCLDRIIEEQLKAQNVMVQSLSKSYFSGDVAVSKQGFILGFTALNEAEMAEGVQTIKKVMEILIDGSAK